MDNIWYLVIGITIGMIVGIITAVINDKKKTTNGLLIIDVTDSDTNRYKFCIDDLDDLEFKKTLILSIKKGAVDWED